MAKTEKKVKKVNNFDYTLLFLVAFILLLGFVMLYSTSAYKATIDKGDGIYFLKRQMQAATLGFGVLSVLSSVNYRIFRKFTNLIFAVSFVLCCLTFIVGASRNGSSRWLNLGGFSLQPSEIAKLAVIMFYADIISRRTQALRDFKMVARTMVVCMISVAPIIVTNLSTAAIVVGIAVIMLFVAYPGIKEFILLGIGVLVLGVVAIMAASYRASRIEAWLHPEMGGEGTYQTLQGLYAIGSGGLFGKGLGNSTQKMGYLPEANNDMIFTIICEELGIFGAICIILLYILLLYRLVYIANHAKDMYGSYLCIGIMGHVALQVILNIGVVTNTIPNTGVTLPFISYGGTSVLMLLAEMGIALSVSRQMDFNDGLDIE